MIEISPRIAVLLATAVVHAQPGDVRLRAARVLDGTGQVLENVTVVVRGSTITAVEASSANPADIDLRLVDVAPRAD